MIYPLIVLIAALLIVVLLFIFVVPRFQDIYQELLAGGSLPLPTQIVIDGCEFLHDQGWSVVTLIAIVVIFMKYSFSIDSVSRLLDGISLRMPYLGELVRKVSVARFTRTLSTLLSSGVSLPESFSLTREVMSNRVMRDSLERAYVGLLDGESMATALEKVKLFPPVVSGMINVGEEIGYLPTMLNRIANSYDEEVDTIVAGFTTIIEPCMIILLAIVIGFIVIALFLPIIDIIQHLTGG
jgi:type IV pilus assembly protein PilC